MQARPASPCWLACPGCSALSNIPGSVLMPPPLLQGTFSLIIEALHTDSPDDLATGKTN